MYLLRELLDKVSVAWTHKPGPARCGGRAVRGGSSKSLDLVVQGGARRARARGAGPARRGGHAVRGGTLNPKPLTWVCREERGVRVRVELGPRDAAAGQCVLATHAGPPGQPAAKRVVAAGPALAAAARAALGLPAQQGEEEQDDDDGEGWGPDGAPPALIAGGGKVGVAGGGGASSAKGVPPRGPGQGEPGQQRAGAGGRGGDEPLTGEEGGAGKKRKKKKEKENRRDMQAPAAGADAGSEPGRAAADPEAGRAQQAPLGSDGPSEVGNAQKSAKRKGPPKPEGPAVGGASAAPDLARAAGGAARAGRRAVQPVSGDDLGEAFAIEVEEDGGARKGRKKKKQPVSGDDLGDEFAIEVEEDDGYARKGRKKKKQRALDAPQTAGGEPPPNKRKAGKLVKF